MIDIEKLKIDYAEGKAVSWRNVKALIEEVERLQYEVDAGQDVVDAGKVIVSQMQARAEAAAEITASIQKNGRIHGKVAVCAVYLALGGK